ncbi:malonyl-CoA decarboxylase [Sphingomonas oryzagri]
MPTESFGDQLKSFSRSGRALLQRYVPFVDWERTGREPAADRIVTLAEVLLSVKGEASGLAIAADLLEAYRSLDGEGQLRFFVALSSRHDPEPAHLKQMCDAYSAQPSAETLRRLMRASEPPRRELFRRLNMLPGATSQLVTMRSHLLAHLKQHPELARVDDDLRELLEAWFNRGFLELRRLTWSSPADILERIIRYEAVHSIHDWVDLRGRLDPPDRRCFAFFHPAMPDEPLIFVEVALTADMPDRIEDILARDRAALDIDRARCAVFYSISNCQAGLQGISFGNFLIKQVVADLSRELIQLDRFVTLSPVPGLMRYLTSVASQQGQGEGSHLSPGDVEQLARPGWWDDPERAAHLADRVLPEAVRYFLEHKRSDGKPADPVARFHLGNGARLERINWLGDRSPGGLRQSGGVMVNYLYDLAEIEENHEAYAGGGVVRTGKPVRAMARAAEGRQRQPRRSRKRAMSERPQRRADLRS